MKRNVVSTLGINEEYLREIASDDKLLLPLKEASGKTFSFSAFSPFKEKAYGIYALAVSLCLFLGAAAWHYYFASRHGAGNDQIQAELSYIKSRDEQVQSQLASISKILNFLVPAVKSLKGVEETSVSQDEAAAEASSAPISSANKIAKVAVGKANLRSAPDSSAAIVMTVARGSQLLVEEAKNDWLRVTAPSGETVWVSKSVVEPS